MADRVINDIGTFRFSINRSKRPIPTIVAAIAGSTAEGLTGKLKKTTATMLMA